MRHRFFGGLSYGVSRYGEGRIRIGLRDESEFSDTKFTIGADLRWTVWDYQPGTRTPFDFAVGGLFEYVSFGGASVLQLGGQAIGSAPIAVGTKTTLTPYGRITLRMESVDTDFGGSDSNLEFGLNGGVEWPISPVVTFFGEFQLDGNDGIFFGFDYNVQ